MKKIYITILCLISCAVSSNIFADSMSGAGTLNTITEVINSMSANGAIDADVARYRINYYSDQIFVHGTNLNAVLTGSEDWARSELWNVISKKLLWLKDQGYLTEDKYKTYITSYTGITSTGAFSQFGTLYKDYLIFEKEIIDNEIPRTQAELLNTYKDRLSVLLKDRRITQEKYYSWLEKIKIQIYQYKSDPNLMSSEFDEEAARYTTIIPCDPCSSSCTTDSLSANCTQSNTSVAQNSSDYSKEIKTKYGKLYAKMSLRNLQLTLTRTKKLEKKYKIGTKTNLKIQAQIKLLNEEIAKKKKVSVKK